MIQIAHSYSFGFCPYCDCLHLTLEDESGAQFAEMTVTIEQVRAMLRALERHAADSIGACQNLKPS